MLDSFVRAHPLRASMEMQADTMPTPQSRETVTIVRLSSRLISALRVVIDSAPFAGLGPIELARTLGLDKTLASRLMAAFRARDAMTALSLLPGVVPMRRFLAAARAHGARSRAVADAESRLHTFAQELERAFGTRTRLDALIADALPAARQRHEETARQAVYRGMALIKGVSIDLESFTWILHPAPEGPGRVDILFLAGFIGIHRLRPTARFRVSAAYRARRPEKGPRLLRRFCRPADVSISRSVEKDYIFYEVSTGSVRRDAAADLVLTDFMPGSASRTVSARSREVWSVGDVLAYPVRRLELVLLVHRDVWPDADFSMVAYDTATRGPVRLPDAERDADRLDVSASVSRSPASPDMLRASPVPDYPAIVSDLAAEHGWRLETASGQPAFRKFHCAIAYPLYGAQFLLVRT